MFAWGKRHFQDAGEGISLIDTETGHFADPVLVDQKSGKPIRSPAFRFVAGENASAATIRRLGRGG
jgi:hypothetical protein